MKIMRFKGFSKYLTVHYWRMRWFLILWGHPYAEIVEVGFIDIPDSQLDRLNSDTPMDTSDYVSATIEPLSRSERLEVILRGLFGMNVI